jgi:hypothetical protein
VIDIYVVRRAFNSMGPDPRDNNRLVLRYGGAHVRIVAEGRRVVNPAPSD